MAVQLCPDLENYVFSNLKRILRQRMEFWDFPSENDCLNYCVCFAWVWMTTHTQGSHFLESQVTMQEMVSEIIKKNSLEQSAVTWSGLNSVHIEMTSSKWFLSRINNVVGYTEKSKIRIYFGDLLSHSAALEPNNHLGEFIQVLDSWITDFQRMTKDAIIEVQKEQLVREIRRVTSKARRKTKR